MSQTPQDATTAATAAETAVGTAAGTVDPVAGHMVSDEVARLEQSTKPGRSDYPVVEAVLASLQRLDEIPVDEHPSVFEQAHQRLRSVLTQAHAGPGDTSPGN